MTLYVNTNIGSVDMQRGMDRSSQISDGAKTAPEVATAAQSADDVVDITESLDSILAALGVDKAHMASPIDDQNIGIEEVDDRLRDRNYAADAVKALQTGIMNQGATSILAQANQKTLYALSLLQD